MAPGPTLIQVDFRSVPRLVSVCDVVTKGSEFGTTCNIGFSCQMTRTSASANVVSKRKPVISVAPEVKTGVPCPGEMDVTVGHAAQPPTPELLG